VVHRPWIATLALDRWPTFVSINVEVSSLLVGNLIRNGKQKLEALQNLSGQELATRILSIPLSSTSP